MMVIYSLNQFIVKNFRMFLSLFFFSITMSVVSAQTSQSVVDTKNKEVCQPITNIAVAEKIKTQDSQTVKKAIVSTQKRRLKSYESNHRIARKRKPVAVENALASN